MDFLGIGPLELLFIVVIIIVVIGPKDIQRTMRTLGRGLNSLYKSEGWKAFNEASRQLRSLPNKLAEEAELEEVAKTARELNQEIAAAKPELSAWTTGSKEKKPALPAPAAASTAPAPAAAPAAPVAPAAAMAAAGSSQAASRPAPSPRLSSKQPLPGAEVAVTGEEPVAPPNGGAHSIAPETSGATPAEAAPKPPTEPPAEAQGEGTESPAGASSTNS